MSEGGTGGRHVHRRGTSQISQDKAGSVQLGRFTLAHGGDGDFESGGGIGGISLGPSDTDSDSDSSDSRFVALSVKG